MQYTAMDHFNRFLLSIVTVGMCGGCASRTPHQPAPYVGGCSHVRELPPLELTSKHKRLLASVSTTPKTALDYYMLLPKSYFSIMPDSPERRVTYVRTETLSDTYLHARRWFECDGGGFDVTLKLYRSSAGTFVAIKNEHGETIFDDGEDTKGEPSITIQRPTLWRYADGAWKRQPRESVPKISPKRVLAKYHHDWDADRQFVGQRKFIWIDYNFIPESDDLVLMGRENFQPSVYEYARLHWRGPHFSFE